MSQLVETDRAENTTTNSLVAGRTFNVQGDFLREAQGTTMNHCTINNCASLVCPSSLHRCCTLTTISIQTNNIYNTCETCNNNGMEKGSKVEECLEKTQKDITDVKKELQEGLADLRKEVSLLNEKVDKFAAH